MELKHILLTAALLLLPVAGNAQIQTQSTINPNVPVPGTLVEQSGPLFRSNWQAAINDINVLFGRISAGGATGFVDVATANPPLACDGTDQTANLNTLLTTLQGSLTGATLLFHGCTYSFSSPIILPNDGSGGAPHQVAIIFQGVGSQRSGETGAYPGRATTLDIRTSNANGHIQTYGIGALGLRDLTITDGGTSGGNPFVYTTNTTVYAYHNLILGNALFNGTTNDQDAFVLGGTTTGINGTASAAFQGYGTVISENQFDRIRRMVYCRVFCNGVIIEKNWLERNSGNPLANGSVIELDGTGAGGAPGQVATSNVIRDNVIEISNYPYFINNLVANYTMVTGNSLFDPTATTVAGILNSAVSVDAFVVGNLLTGKPYVAGTTASITFIGMGADGRPSTFPAGVGPLTVNGAFNTTGLTSIFGVAGSSNLLSLPQTAGAATFNADGTNVIFRNTATTGTMFFDNLTSGGAYNFRSGGGITNVLDYNNTTANAWVTSKNFLGQALGSKGTVPTGNTGTCSTGVTVAGGATVGTWTSTAICGLAGTIILTAMPTVPTGYVCDMSDRTTQGVVIEQTATTTSGATFAVRSLPTGTVATVANDILQYKCLAY